MAVDNHAFASLFDNLDALMSAHELSRIQCVVPPARWCCLVPRDQRVFDTVANNRVERLQRDVDIVMQPEFAVKTILRKQRIPGTLRETILEVESNLSTPTVRQEVLGHGLAKVAGQRAFLLLLWLVVRVPRRLGVVSPPCAAH